jgi:hypothetical protein
MIKDQRSKIKDQQSDTKKENIKPMKYILFSAVLALTCLRVSAAEPAKAHASGTVYFRTLGVNINAEDIVYKNGGKFLPITLSEAVRSSFFETTGGLNADLLPSLITPSSMFSTGAQVRRFAESIEQIPADEEGAQARRG